jgi:PAS domain S-box-containing protein
MDPGLRSPLWRVARWLGRACLVVLLLASACVACWQIRGYFAEFERLTREQLQAIADGKVRQLIAWREERVRDGEELRRTPALAAEAQRALANPQDEAARNQLQPWLTALLANPNYQRIFLLDAQGKQRLVVPAGEASLDPGTEAVVGEALRTNGVVLSDLHRKGDSSRINMDLLVPLGGGAGQPAGILCLEINPYVGLFPMVLSWPLPSRTAEAALVRREEGSVLFLNDLRNQVGAALSLRLSLNDPDLPSARAARGEKGVVETKDYRRVNVLSALAAIPDSPWFLIAKVDSEELLAKAKQPVWVLIAAAVTMGAIIVYGIWRLVRQVQQKSLLRDLAQERERQALNERIASLTRDASDIMLLTDKQGQILELNERATEAYGHAVTRLRQMTLRELMAPQARAEFDRQLAKTPPGSPLAMSTLHQRKDGSTFPVEWHLRPIELGGIRYYQVVARDLTVRQQATEEIRRLDRQRGIANRMARVIAPGRSEAELLAQVCQLAVEAGGFKLAWIGWHETASRILRSVAAASADPEPVPEIIVSSEASRTEGQGPGSSALREQKSVLLQELSADTRATIRKESAGRAGIQSCAAFPLKRGGQVHGVLCLYAGQAQAFAAQEAAIWEEVAALLSLALDAAEAKGAPAGHSA